MCDSFQDSVMIKLHLKNFWIFCEKHLWTTLNSHTPATENSMFILIFCVSRMFVCSKRWTMIGFCLLVALNFNYHFLFFIIFFSLFCSYSSCYIISFSYSTSKTMLYSTSSSSSYVASYNFFTMILFPLIKTWRYWMKMYTYTFAMNVAACICACINNILCICTLCIWCTVGYAKEGEEKKKRRSYVEKLIHNFHLVLVDKQEMLFLSFITLYT